MQLNRPKKLRRIYNNLIKLFVLACAFIIATTILNRFSASPINISGLSHLIPDFSTMNTGNWFKSWGIVSIIAIVLTPILYKVFSHFHHSRIVKLSNIHTVDGLTGEEFEQFLLDFFTMQGYSVKKTKQTRDHGANLILNAPGQCIVVQAKRVRGKVSNSAVQEVVATKPIYNATDAWVVTNSYFTDPAKELAKANNVVLWDRTRLIKELAKTFGNL